MFRGNASISLISFKLHILTTKGWEPEKFADDQLVGRGSVGEVEVVVGEGGRGESPPVVDRSVQTNHGLDLVLAEEVEIRLRRMEGVA